MKIQKKELEFHRKTAFRCFNKAWDYLEMKRRSIEEDHEMLCLAHTSHYHWGLVGTAKNKAVSDWQLSRVYADLGQPDFALQFGKSCLSKFQRNHLNGLVHTGNEAVARAYAAGKKYSLAKRYLSKARQQLENLTLDQADREIFSGQLHDTELLIK